MSSKRPFDLRLYVVLDPAVAGERPLLEVARQALAGGATMLQLRDKRSPDRALLAAAEALAALCRAARVPFIVNDRVDIAWACGADGVHLGQDDLPLPAARKLLGESAIIGASAGNLQELRDVVPGQPDYVGVGPMYATRTKRDAGAAVGPAILGALRQAAPGIPLVGIGGITAENAAAVLAAGADGIAVVSAVVGAADVEAAARALRAL